MFSKVRWISDISVYYSRVSFPGSVCSFQRGRVGSVGILVAITQER